MQNFDIRNDLVYNQDIQEATLNYGADQKYFTLEQRIILNLIIKLGYYCYFYSTLNANPYNSYQYLYNLFLWTIYTLQILIEFPYLYGKNSFPLIYQNNETSRKKYYLSCCIGQNSIQIIYQIIGFNTGLIPFYQAIFSFCAFSLEIGIDIYLIFYKDKTQSDNKSAQQQIFHFSDNKSKKRQIKQLDDGRANILFFIGIIFGLLYSKYTLNTISLIQENQRLFIFSNQFIFIYEEVLYIFFSIPVVCLFLAFYQFIEFSNQWTKHLLALIYGTVLGSFILFWLLVLAISFIIGMLGLISYQILDVLGKERCVSFICSLIMFVCITLIVFVK